MKFDINLIWAIVVLLVAGMAAAYSINRQKLEKLKLTHPKLASVLETAGELALKASDYQASLDGKKGAEKLADATDEVYNQLAELYPNVPINRNTVRNYVQHMYDNEVVKSADQNASQTAGQNADHATDQTSTAVANVNADASKPEAK